MRRYLFALSALSLLARPVGAVAQDTELNRYTLEDLTGVFVRTEVNAACEDAGVMMGAVRAQSETSLIESEVELLTENEMLETPGLPELRIELECVVGEGAGLEGAVAFSVSARLMQSAQMIRDTQITLAEAVTWYTSTIGVAESAGIQTAVQAAASETVAAFVAAFEAINAEPPDTTQVREVAAVGTGAADEAARRSASRAQTTGHGGHVVSTALHSRRLRFDP